MLKPYNKEFNYSYALGVYPSIELLNNKPEQVVKVIMDPKGEKNSGFQKIEKACAEHSIPIEINQKIVTKLSPSGNTYVVTVFNKYEEIVTKDDNHVVLVNPSDMGNLGTILRTMTAFDFTNLALIRPASDIFDPKVIRASMGALFSVNFEYFQSLEEYKDKFNNHKMYLFRRDGKVVLNKAIFNKPYSLVFGNEGEGLDEKYNEFGESVYIPQSVKVDSLNLSAAVAVSLYTARVGSS